MTLFEKFIFVPYILDTRQSVFYTQTIRRCLANSLMGFTLLCGRPSLRQGMNVQSKGTGVCQDKLQTIC